MTRRRKRFEFEARTVADLNHPKFVVVFDVGNETGFCTWSRASLLFLK